MKNEQFKAVAGRAGTSISSVSKVLNHCGGVDSALRRKVFAAADSLQLTRCREADCDIYLITPERPTYFWKNRVYKALVEASGIYRSKYNVYTRLGDDYVLRYLEEAERLRTPVILFAGTPSERERVKLEKLAERRLVLLLYEYSAVKNAFYVGCDARRDGFAVGTCLVQRQFGTPVIFNCSQNENANRRLAGCLEALGGAASHALVRELPAYNKLFPAKAAEILSELPPGGTYSVYSTGGTMAPLLLAAQKAGLYERCLFFGHDMEECPDQTRIAMVIRQDIERQVKWAMKFAGEYLESRLCPAEKCTTVASELLTFPDAAQGPRA